MKKQGKLVRDRIPERIEAKGESCTWHTAATDHEFGEKLGLKLLEEVDEFAREQTMLEFADVCEVLEAIIPFHRLDTSLVREAYVTVRVFTREEYDDKDLEYDLTMELGELAVTFVAHPTPENLTELVRRLWEVAAFQRFERDDVELMRLAKRESHGGFDERIILDES